MVVETVKMSVLGAAIALAAVTFATPSAREVREYECDYPVDGEQGFYILKTK